MKITKTQLFKIISEVLSNQDEEDLSLSNEAKNILMFLIMPALNTKKFNSVEDFLSRTTLLIGENYGYLEFTLEIDNQTAGFANYNSVTRKDSFDGMYCRPDPHENRSTYMLTQIARSDQFKGFGVGRLLAFLSVCYINGKNGSITSDRDTSDYAGKELVDSLDAIGAVKSEKFDYVGWLLGKIQRMFFKDGQYVHRGRRSRPEAVNVSNRHVPEETNARSPKTSAKRTKLPQKQPSLSHEEEIESLVREFLKIHSPMTSKVSDDCKPSVNISYQGISLDLIPYKGEAFKSFLRKANSVSSEQLQEMLDSDERVQGYTFILKESFVNVGNEICNVLVNNNQYDSEEIHSRMDQANSMFRDVYNRSVKTPGVGYKELDSDYMTDKDEDIEDEES